jgi:hypothetical protein
MAKADSPEDVEYVLCVDERWGFDNYKVDTLFLDAGMGILMAVSAGCRIVWNTGRKCSVDGWNTAAAGSTGEILIINSDDMFPPAHWDTELRRVAGDLNRDFVIEVSSGTIHDQRRLMVLQILSRVRYERLGYAIYPEYLSMAGDDDFGEHARHDGVVIEARHLIFPHKHALYENKPYDSVYNHENSSEAVILGDRILARRRAEGFSR